MEREPGRWEGGGLTERGAGRGGRGGGPHGRGGGRDGWTRGIEKKSGVTGGMAPGCREEGARGRESKSGVAGGRVTDGKQCREGGALRFARLVDPWQGKYGSGGDTSGRSDHPYSSTGWLHPAVHLFRPPVI